MIVDHTIAGIELRNAIAHGCNDTATAAGQNTLWQLV
jgi:hypothetical protein